MSSGDAHFTLWRPFEFRPQQLFILVCRQLQRHVLDLVKDGKNVFFTGNAGTGKSFLLNRVVESLREMYGSGFKDCVAVTAATGIAATHVGGRALPQP